MISKKISIFFACPLRFEDHTCTSGHLKEENEGLEEGLEVVDVVEASSDLNISEQRHSKDGEDEHDQEEKEADVEEGWHRHDEGEEQGSDPLRPLDQTQHSTNLNKTDDYYPRWFLSMMTNVRDDFCPDTK